MKTHNYLKISAILVAATLQGILFSYLWAGHSGLQYAGETPEPGSICLLAVGAIALMRKKYRNQ